MIKGIQRRFSGKPLLQVEVGNFLQGVGPDRFVKNKWLWDGMKQLGVDVINVGEDDYPELLALNVDPAKSDRFISANLTSAASGELLLQPYVIKNLDIPGRERPFRLGFLGLAGRDSYLDTEEQGYLWTDVKAAAKRWVPEAKSKCDFLVVVACLPARDAVQLAIDHSQINVILTGFKHQTAQFPAKISQSTVIYAEDEGKMLGDLRFQITGDHELEVNNFFHYLTREVADDPEMAGFVAKAKSEISKVQNEIVQGNGNGLRQTTLFGTTAKCIGCHSEAHAVWEKSKHAHAIDILKQQKKEFDTSCVGCHVTGAGMSGGFVDLLQTPHLANVQCEACHGPGNAHANDPGQSKMMKVGSTVCLTCHTKTNSPEFEFAPYWAKVKH
ncbi:MAG: multiheme c-type cytochrome [Acidobacteriota bacterium]